MAHWVYILYSRTADRSYVGETADIELRLEQHRTHHYRGSYTLIAVDWVLCVSLHCRDKRHALAVESYIKKQKRRSFVERLVNEESLRTWLLGRF
ncbi:MAG: GIY-YIG nuclease family protein [Flavobacteriales bacterium]